MKELYQVMFGFSVIAGALMYLLAKSQKFHGD